MSPEGDENGRARLISQTSILSQPDLVTPDELFTQYTIDEIKRNYKKIQRDIEYKKRDLRGMVGERYRDLIETADTIQNMVSSVHNIQSTLEALQESCNLVGRETKTEDDNKQEEFWSVASQMKLLVDTPEKIWHAMENHNYLLSGQLYLLSRHIVTNLQITCDDSSTLLDKYPVLRQQWGSISQFKTPILQGCKKVLGNSALTVDEFIDNICCIVLLEETDLDAVLTQFLSERSQVPDFNTNLSTTEQIKVCVDVIQNTIEVVRQALLPENLIAKKIDQLCNRISTIEVVTDAFIQETALHSITRHLPLLVQSYHPSVNCSLEIRDLQQKCKDWLQDVTSVTHKNVTHALHYVTAVSSVIDHVTVFNTKSSEEWKEACKSVLGVPLDIWNDVLILPVNEQIKRLTDLYFEDLLHFATKNIDKIVLDEGQVTWLSWEQCTDKELSIKTEAITLPIHELCCKLNERFTEIYDDIILYTGNPDKIRFKQNKGVPEQCYGYFVEASRILVRKLAEYIDEMKCDASTSMMRIVHICRSLVTYTPKLQQILILSHDQSADGFQPIKDVKNRFISRYNAWLSSFVAEHLAALLPLDYETFAVSWEDTTITEETESSDKIESKISLPIYCSSYVTTVLYALCDELYRVGAHGLEDGDMRGLVGGVHSSVVNVYSNWVETNPDLTQNMALQHWLDFRYIASVTDISSNPTRNQKVTNTIRLIENYVDPFDWDVFLPHLTTNLHTLLRRTYNVYSCVARYSTTVQALIAATPSPSQQVTHNIMMTNEMTPRFNLLPIMSGDNVSRDVHTPECNLSNIIQTLNFFTSPVG